MTRAEHMREARIVHAEKVDGLFDADAFDAGYLAGFKKALELADNVILANTGGTGGWLQSPKKVSEAIRKLDE